MTEFDINQIPEEHKHTQHINPGVDTTIKCCHYDVCYMIHAHNKCINDKPTEIPCIFDSRNEINFSRCVPHTPAHPPEAQQRINAAIKELEHIRDMVDDTKDLSDTYRVKGISSCVQSELTDIMKNITHSIALLQAGDPK